MMMSIVVPSFQRRDHLIELLSSIGRAVTPDTRSRLEVVVVLDGSTDGSREYLESLSEPVVPVRCVWQENSGAAAARNRGVSEARGELIWFLDDDLRPTRQALAAHLGWAERERTPILMGPCVIPSTAADFAVAKIWYDERWNRLARRGVVEDPIDLTFANASMPAEIARRHPFNSSFRGYGPEDLELSIRLLEAGVRVAYDHSAEAVHDFRPSWTERLRKLREEGVNRLRLLELHPGAADLIFSPNPGRAERLLRRIAHTQLARLLWPLANLLGRLGQLGLPSSIRIRLQGLAELAALYSGVSQGPAGSPTIGHPPT